ncbi:hypothetical protein T10_8661 [Trichinella papuae]|uniref:Uncharacterized protein n=1 Tax=Trichinella papuae TaxID=268474 RepID=A0A0V1MCJ4_9BILA|nr:hypothetical protein T10_8661 [Trichinella papuae]
MCNRYFSYAYFYHLCSVLFENKASILTILSMTVLFHSDNFTLPILKRAQHHSVTYILIYFCLLSSIHQYKHRKRTKCFHLLGSIVVSIPACHAGDPGSIPGRGKQVKKKK